MPLEKPRKKKKSATIRLNNPKAGAKKKIFHAPEFEDWRDPGVMTRRQLSSKVIPEDWPSQDLSKALMKSKSKKKIAPAPRWKKKTAPRRTKPVMQ